MADLWVPGGGFDEFRIKELEDLKSIIREDERYESFTFLDNEVLFKDMFKDKNIDLVQIHSTHVYTVDDKKYIMGFAGIIKWENNKIISLDGDSYTENMLIIGFDWFEDDDGRECLDILATYW